MKIRKGFVSNSSSSSFVVVGKEASFSDIDDPSVMIYDDENGSEGVLFFRPDNEIIKFMKENPKKYRCSFIKTIDSFYKGKNELTQEHLNKLKNLDKDCFVMIFMIDQWKPDFKEFKEYILS